MAAAALPSSLLANPVLGRWIGFERPGEVRIATGKVELGQGIATTLAQIAAEELDVELSRIRLVSGDTAASPSEGFTSGSNSTEVSGGSIRIACAEARGLMLRAVAEALGCDAGDLVVDDGRFVRGNAFTGHDYWSAAQTIDFGQPVTGAFAVKPAQKYRIVGRSVARFDLEARFGGGAFIHDLAPEGMLHARVLHRPWPDARLAGLDLEAIAARTGVRTMRSGDLVAFASEDEFCVVRALEIARAAAVWEGGRKAPERFDTADALRAYTPSRTRVLEAGAPGSATTGDRVTAAFSRPFLTHGSIAPSCALAEFRDGQLTVWTHSQGVFTLRDWLARALALEPAAVHVIHHAGAGAYGHNSADDAAFDAAFVATQLPGRPVRAQWTRQDEFTVAPMGPAMAVEIRAELDARQRPLDWTLEIWSPPHGQRPGMNGLVNLLGARALPDAAPVPGVREDIPDAIGGGATRNAVALYDLPHQHIVHHVLDDVPARSSTLRALGSHLNTIAIESMIDELAERAGADPVDYRLALTADPRMAAVIRHAAAMGGWSADQPVGEGRAKGLAFGRYKNKAAYVAVVAEVLVEEAVRVERAWCAVDAGLVINPGNAASQIEGGLVQAASWTLKEEIRFEGGVVATRSWADYPILRFSEVPEIAVEFVGDVEQPTLGIGEASIGPAAAAIVNAVARALGFRIRALPITRERLMAAMLA